jgi:cytochrome c biogenesis protein CcmG/thiol:disulfide interchange protein DsbE
MKGKQIILLLLLAAGAAAIILSVRHGGTKKPVAVGLYAPDFSVTDFRTGKTLSSSDLKGKVILVNFWASWCEPCKEEMPSVDALYREMGSDKDFIMITILYRDTPVTALAYMKSQGYGFPVYGDPAGSAAHSFGVTGVPETYIIDKNGVLQKKMIGPDNWNSPGERDFISSLLR